MNAVFADTFYSIALTSPAEVAHVRASQFSGKIITTDEVLSEYLKHPLRLHQLVCEWKRPGPFRTFFKIEA